MTEILAPTIETETIANIDAPLAEGKGCLRDYVATGLISREMVEISGGDLAYETTFEAPNTHPGTARSTTVRISQTAYDELGKAGVP